ncbi:hypothetical protein AJ78_08786 [Emergomyces pasteurianus Ep9510]|uniref:Nucleoside phosphorylase domain-containing protein n=1 Tax=Emergomyces pasteurianus Ep9510 TaxID=1447872 RepID=A0A1J9Q4E4_9EURO|nr:hypothetical protein AJ78_08786 [Emergomyces pasteurianus Ep9510]
MAWPLEETRQLTLDDYTVAWICALPKDLTAARNMLDERHRRPPQPEADQNIYTYGRIFAHNVVIVCQSDMGTTAAASVANQLVNSFRKLRFGLLVGIAGGVPDKKDIRLGDVVISKGDGRSGGVVVHDRGKVTPMGFESRPYLNGVPGLLINAFNELESLQSDQESAIPGHISRAIERNPRFKSHDRPTLEDCLFKSGYDHIDPERKTCEKCLERSDQVEIRQSRGAQEHIPVLHFGAVASGDQVIKDSARRKQIAETYPYVLAIEMEAGGLMNIFGCATIRGICDYADSHKNDSWQNYAAATAAATTKEVLRVIPGAEMNEAPAITTTDRLGSHFHAAPAENHQDYNVDFQTPIPAVSSTFIKRDELQQIKDALLPLQHPRQQRVFVLYGVGGIGKSRLAIEFAREYHNEFTAVFWLDGSTNSSLTQSIASIKERLPTHQQPDRQHSPKTGPAAELQNVVQDVLMWLNRRGNDRWLLIFDNIDRDWTPETSDPDAFDILRYIPRADHGSILVTTRLSHLGSAWHSVKVSRMNPDQSKELLESTARRPIVGWERLATALDGLALALTLAGSYLRQHRLSVDKYLELYHKAFERLLTWYGRHQIIPVISSQLGKFHSNR